MLFFLGSFLWLGHTVCFPGQFPLIGTHCLFSWAVYFDWDTLFVFLGSLLCWDTALVFLGSLICLGHTGCFPGQFTLIGTQCWFSCGVYFDWDTLMVFLCSYSNWDTLLGFCTVYSNWDTLFVFLCSLLWLGHTVGFPGQFTVIWTNCSFSWSVYCDWDTLLVFLCSLLWLGHSVEPR